MNAINALICALRTLVDADAPNADHLDDAHTAFHALPDEQQGEARAIWVQYMAPLVARLCAEQRALHPGNLDGIMPMLEWVMGVGPQPNDRDFGHIERHKPWNHASVREYRWRGPLHILCANHARDLGEEYDHHTATLAYQSGYHGRCYVELLPLLEVSVVNGWDDFDTLSDWFDGLILALDAWSDDEIYHRCEDGFYEETQLEAYSEYLGRIEHEMESILEDHDVETPDNLYAVISDHLSDALEVEQCEPGEWHAYCHSYRALYALIDDLLPNLDGDDREVAFTALDRA